MSAPGASRSSPPDYPACAACGDRIGAYEPLWREVGEGSFVATSLREVRARPGDGEERLFHAGCLAPAAARVGGP